MVQKVYEYFGINLDIDPDVNVAEYKAFHDQLILHLRKLQDVDLRNVEVYIHQLRITIEPVHFGVSPLEDRLSRLDVSIQVNKTAKERKLISFLNPHLSLKLNPNVDVKARHNKISYSLTGIYCSQHGRYDDYIATLVMSECPPKLKKLLIAGTAHATAQFKERLLNLDGMATTKMQFALTREGQLPLSF